MTVYTTLAPDVLGPILLTAYITTVCTATTVITNPPRARLRSRARKRRHARGAHARTRQ